MSATDPIMDELVAFTGPVQCEHCAGAVNLVLRGYAGAPSGPHSGLTEALFSDASAAAVPGALRDARLIELLPAAAPVPGPALRRFRIDSAQLQLELQARSVQLHRDAAAAFYRAVPPLRVPLRLRLGWSLLLAVLRIPGAGALLRKIRGST
ncbi:MAG: hypothetical protein ACHQDB_07380 [Steroidobacterales bacterium]